MSDLAPYPPPPVFKDRSAGLIFVGLLEIGLTLLCLLGLASMALVVASPAARQAGGSLRAVLASALVYAAAGACFAALGVGTLRGRRWARTLGLMAAWIWLVSGVLSLAMLALILPRLTAAVAAAAGAGHEGLGGCVAGCFGAMMVVMYLLLPGFLVLFYRGPNVRATFEAKDPSVPWTDRTPAPLLTLALLLLLAGGATSTLLAYRLFPFLGLVLTGAPAVAAILASLALYLALAWGVYHRRLAAWWGLLAFGAFGCLNGVLVVRQGSAGIRRIYVAMGMPDSQLAQIDRMGILGLFDRPLVLTLGGLFWLGMLGYVVWIRRFFRRA